MGLPPIAAGVSLLMFSCVRGADFDGRFTLMFLCVRGADFDGAFHFDVLVRSLVMVAGAAAALRFAQLV